MRKHNEQRGRDESNQPSNSYVTKTERKSKEKKVVYETHYERYEDENPRPEKGLVIRRRRKGKNDVVKREDLRREDLIRIPYPAHVHESGERIQVNCCLTTWCKNFAKPCLIPEDPKQPNGNMTLADGYRCRYGIRTDNGQKRNVQMLVCEGCNKDFRIWSNRGVSEVINQLLRKYAPALFCYKCSLPKESDGSKPTNYEWSYSNPEPKKILNSSSFADSGARRVLCKNKGCNSTRTVTWKKYPQLIEDVVQNPESYLRDFHDVATLGASAFERTVLVTDKTLYASPNYKDSRLSRSFYYSSLDRYQFIAVEWLGYYNNMLRTKDSINFGDVQQIKDAVIRSRMREKEEESEPQDNNDSSTGNSDHLNSDGASDDHYKKEMLGMPRILTDTLILSAHVKGAAVPHQEFRLMISVLVPSDYILLATLNFSDTYNQDILSKLYFRMSQGNAGLWKFNNEDREYVVHPQLLSVSDPHKSHGSKGRKREHVDHFFDNGLMIRRPYHSLAHFYTLEKITSKIPQIVQVLDGERDTLNACVWAFRNRIAKENCHIIVSSDDRQSAQTRKENPSQDRDVLFKKLQNSIEERKEQFMNRQNVCKSTSDEDKFEFCSPLFTQGSFGGKLRKKRWLSVNTLLSLDDSSIAAQMLMAATLGNVDSVCNQLRRRNHGFIRGQVSAQQDGLSYISHWQNPNVIQKLADIFAFSKNCLTWHSRKPDFVPPVALLGLSELNKHLIHYLDNEISGEVLFGKKFNFPLKSYDRKKKEVLSHE